MAGEAPGWGPGQLGGSVGLWSSLGWGPGQLGGGVGHWSSLGWEKQMNELREFPVPGIQ